MGKNGLKCFLLLFKPDGLRVKTFYCIKMLFVYLKIYTNTNFHGYFRNVRVRHSKNHSKFLRFFRNTSEYQNFQFNTANLSKIMSETKLIFSKELRFSDDFQANGTFSKVLSHQDAFKYKLNQNVIKIIKAFAFFIIFLSLSFTLYQILRWFFIYHIYSKIWDTSNSYHICPKI